MIYFNPGPGFKLKMPPMARSKSILRFRLGIQRCIFSTKLFTVSEEDDVFVVGS